MIVGVPKEVKESEHRVAATPAVVEELVRHGHEVLIEAGAGLGSGIADEEYAAVGGRIVGSPADVYASAELVVKVKEPLPHEIEMLREGQVLFAYLHLAPDRELTQGLLDKGVVGIAYETVQLPTGQLPLLMPMSEVAGRMAIQIGASFLERVRGGAGVLLGGIPGVEPAQVVIVGGGTVGTQSAKVALGMGAHVTIIDNNVERLRYLEDILQGRFQTRMSNRYEIARAVRTADLLVGAVLIPGARTPRLVTEDMVATMKAGSVIIDVAVDQGGCIETIDRVTTHTEPTFVKHGVIHYAVPNIPGAVPRTSTFGLTNVTLPYILELANKGYRRAALENPSLARGVNVCLGEVTHPAVAEAHSLPYRTVEQVLA
ncbi:MAG: alanine dehydrogenase [Firmicutes bacterium]|nr:alanine dehydrogenase [Bacillota bacterium]